MKIENKLGLGLKNKLGLGWSEKVIEAFAYKQMLLSHFHFSTENKY